MTKKGMKLWGSGIIVMLMSIAFSVMLEGLPEGMSLWELAFIALVALPLMFGWVQRWYWTRETDDVEPEEL